MGLKKRCYQKKEDLERYNIKSRLVKKEKKRDVGLPEKRKKGKNTKDEHLFGDNKRDQQILLGIVLDLSGRRSCTYGEMVKNFQKKN